MNVTILSGSSRLNNNTIRLAKAIQKIYPKSQIVDYQHYDLPNFNEDEFKIGETKFQRELILSIDKADLLFILTPEYNWFPTAEIINTIHWLGGNSTAHIFDNMVVATAGVSVGRGGRMPAVQLTYVMNKVFSFFNLNSICSPKTFEAQEILNCIAEDGKLLDNQMFNKGLDTFVSHSLKVAKRWRAN